MSEKPLLLPHENRSSTKESDLQLSNQRLLGQLGVRSDTSQTFSQEVDKIASLQVDILTKIYLDSFYAHIFLSQRFS
jgi:hypothetical protein